MKSRQLQQILERVYNKFYHIDSIRLVNEMNRKELIEKLEVPIYKEYYELIKLTLLIKFNIRIY